MRCRRALLAFVVAVGVLALPAAATAQDVRSENMTLLKNVPKVDTATHRAVRGAASFFRDNPQTQERLFRRDRDDDEDDDEDDDDNDVSKQRGVFTTLPDGTAMGLTISGFAKITRSEDGTKVKALVRGSRRADDLCRPLAQRAMLATRQPRRRALQERSGRPCDASERALALVHG